MAVSFFYAGVPLRFTARMISGRPFRTLVCHGNPKRVTPMRGGRWNTMEPLPVVSRQMRKGGEKNVAVLEKMIIFADEI